MSYERYILIFFPTLLTVSLVTALIFRSAMLG